MHDPDPRDVAIFSLIDRFFRKHPPYQNDWFSSANLVDEKYAAAVCAAFPDDNVVAVAEETVIRHKVTILGCEIVGYGRHDDYFYDEDGAVCLRYTNPAPLVSLPDGSSFVVEGPYGFAELRALLDRPKD
ncbi:MAG TPA: hypothetical protein VGX71_07620 [Pseudaminobacter sp.]|nr:hypothetical protein [Pseudaminobacter sp.]